LVQIDNGAGRAARLTPHGVALLEKVKAPAL